MELSFILPFLRDKLQNDQTGTLVGGRNGQSAKLVISVAKQSCCVSRLVAIADNEIHNCRQYVIFIDIRNDLRQSTLVFAMALNHSVHVFRRRLPVALRPHKVYDFASCLRETSAETEL